MSIAALATPVARPLVAAGAVVGLTWASALRGWMVQMAGRRVRVPLVRHVRADPRPGTPPRRADWAGRAPAPDRRGAGLVAHHIPVSVPRGAGRPGDL
jgi:hypothetical protein